jgi:hypothetical protein
MYYACIFTGDMSKKEDSPLISPLGQSSISKYLVDSPLPDISRFSEEVDLDDTVKPTMLTFED